MTRNWTDWEGRVAGSFPLLKFLGSSESSAVFLTNRGADHAVIKVFPATGEAAKTQLANWKAAAALSHSHLIRIYEQGTADTPDGPIVYCVMEHAEEVLSQVDRPLTSEETMDMLGPAVDVLEYLQGKGFAHGRLKPSNILAVQDSLKLSGDAPLKIGQKHGHSAMPQPYDAPEIEQKGVSAAADVWSLGMTLVQVLTQKLPAWDANGPRLPDTLPDQFRDLARRCLRQDPKDRIALAEISQWRLGGGGHAEERPRRYLVPLLAGAAVVIAIALGYSYLTRNETPAPISATTVAPDARVQDAPVATVTQPPATKLERPAAGKPPVVVEKSAPEPVAEEPAVEDRRGSRNTVTTRAATEPPPPGVVQEIVPEVPSRARSTIHGKVPIVIKVHTDASGAVTEAAVESGKSSSYFADMSLKAARQWKFAPGEAREWILKFEYLRNTERPVSVQAAPAR